MDLLPSPTKVGTLGLCLVKYSEANVYQSEAQMGAFYLGGMHTSTILGLRGGLTWKECTLPQTLYSPPSPEFDFGLVRARELLFARGVHCFL